MNSDRMGRLLYCQVLGSTVMLFHFVDFSSVSISSWAVVLGLRAARVRSNTKNAVKLGNGRFEVVSPQN